VNDNLHHTLLRLFRRLPTRLRLAAVHALSPSYTVGAMCAIERADGALLLVRHSYRPRWGIPGGLCRSGEAVDVGARREVREEVGVDVELLGEPGVVVDPYERRVDVVFAARPEDGDAAASPQSPEIVECRWFAPDDLPDLQHETVSALAALARLRGDGRR
jgi:ADP-ribose pyrophosphatase YjhB (NUDIX family)